MSDDKFVSDFIDFLQTWKKTLILLSFVLASCFVLRIYHLTSLPVFTDEAIYIHWAQTMKSESLLRFVPLSDGKHPLFMWVVIPFLKIFTDPLLAGRLVSALTGTMTGLGVFVLSYLLLKDKKVSLTAALIYAVSPYSLFYDRLALVDSMLTFFGIWAVIFALIAVKYKRLDAALFAGFSLGGALLTKSPGIYFALLLPSVIMLGGWRGSRRVKITRFVYFMLLFFFTYITAFSLYNILRLGPEFHMIAVRNKDYVYPLAHFLETPLDPLKPFLIRAFDWFFRLGPSLIFILVPAGLFALIAKNRKALVILFLFSFVPILVSAEFAKVFTARYLILSLPFIFIFTASALTLKQKYQYVLKALFVFYFANAIYVNALIFWNIEKAPLPKVIRSGFLEDWTAGTGIKEVADYIRLVYTDNPDMNIVVATEGYFGTLPDGLQIYLKDLPEIKVIATGLVDFDKIPKNLFKFKEDGYQTYFVVNSTRLLVSPEVLNAEEIASYPKIQRHDGSQEKLYLFKL